jgi:sugar lactone lactonase YvrE
MVAGWCVFVTGIIARPAPAQVPLEGPAAVAWHGPTLSWFVSNSGRSPAKDEGGWIARLDARDKQTEVHWLKGFRTPTGLAVAGEKLYVADGKEIVVVDIATRSIERRIAVARARLLHGVTVDPQGTVYASDTLGNAVYRIKADGTVDLLSNSTRLEGPTGLAVAGTDLVVATWGPITDAATWAARTPGRLLRLSLDTRSITAIGDGPLGHLDGLATEAESFLVTDRKAGKLLRVSADGSVSVLRERLRGPGGIFLDSRRRILAIAERDGNNVSFMTLP